MKKIIIILLFIFTSCYNSADGELSKKQITELEQKVLSSGDKYSYSRLIAFYSDKNNYYELLPYSFVMGSKYHNPDGYFQIYYDLIKINNNGKFSPELIVNLNKDDMDFVISNLKRGAELNDQDCKVFLAKHYAGGFGVIQNKKTADSLDIAL